MDIAVLVLDGVFDTGLAAVLDTFALAGELGGDAARFSVTPVAVRRRVRTAHGLVVPLAPRPRAVPDLVFCPALGAKSPAALDAVLDGREVRDTAALLSEWRSGGARVAAACTGTYVAASAGLLDGHAATTTWWLASHFRSCFPKVALDEA